MRIPIRIINVASVESDPTKLQMVFFRPDEFIAVPASKSGFAFLDIDNVFHGDVEITAPGRLRLHDSFDVTLASTGHSFQIGADNSLNLAADANEIQARNNGAASTLFLNGLGGSITMITSGTGTAQFGMGAMVRLLNTTDVTLASTDHAFQIGPTDGINLRIDNDEIQAVNDGAASDLYLNWGGGGIRLGTNTADVYVSGRLRLSNTTDASATSTDHAFQIGDDAGVNLIIDNNEIQARNNGVASSLNLNIDGGNVAIGNAASLATLNGGQLAFPATQNPSANANTLDDYEEGTWTPTLRFGGAGTGMTFSSQLGSYIKIGGWVTLWFDVTLTAKGSSTGAATVTGVPFASISGPTYGGTIGYCTAMTAGSGTLSCYVTNGTSNLVITSGLSTGTTGTTEADFTNTSRFLGTVTYRAA